jgi:aminoglycoside phosphotransferase (APT) family kinase protein
VPELAASGHAVEGSTAMVDLAERLALALSRLYEDGPAITSLRRVSGGASRETWVFDATAPGGAVHELVLRRDPPGAGVASSALTARSSEFQLLDAARVHGVPVPRVRLLLEPSDELGHGFVMDRVAGETIPRRILRDDEFAAARPLLARQCGEIAARIHDVPLDGLPALARQDADAQLAQWRDLLDGFGEPHPTLELGLRWLGERVPPARDTPVLVHGDFRNGNFVVGPDGVRAVLDWELAHLGDPIEDLGWLCARAWRFGVDRVVGGFGDIDDLLTAYETRSGIRPSLDTLRFWTALASLKWGVICLVQAFTHLNGAIRSVELAAIGRRVVENEWDVLTLIEGGW